MISIMAEVNLEPLDPMKQHCEQVQLPDQKSLCNSEKSSSKPEDDADHCAQSMDNGDTSQTNQISDINQLTSAQDDGKHQPQAIEDVGNSSDVNASVDINPMKNYDNNDAGSNSLGELEKSCNALLEETYERKPDINTISSCSLQQDSQVAEQQSQEPKKVMRFEEFIVDGFAICAFNTWEDLQDEVNEQIAIQKANESKNAIVSVAKSPRKSNKGKQKEPAKTDEGALNAKNVRVRRKNNEKSPKNKSKAVVTPHTSSIGSSPNAKRKKDKSEASTSTSQNNLGESSYGTGEEGISAHVDGPKPQHLHQMQQTSANHGPNESSQKSNQTFESRNQLPQHTSTQAHNYTSSINSQHINRAYDSQTNGQYSYYPYQYHPHYPSYHYPPGYPSYDSSKSNEQHMIRPPQQAPYHQQQQQPVPLGQPARPTMNHPQYYQQPNTSSPYPYNPYPNPYSYPPPYARPPMPSYGQSNSYAQPHQQPSQLPPSTHPPPPQYPYMYPPNYQHYSTPHPPPPTYGSYAGHYAPMQPAQTSSVQHANRASYQPQGTVNHPPPSVYNPQPYITSDTTTRRQTTILQPYPQNMDQQARAHGAFMPGHAQNVPSMANHQQTPQHYSTNPKLASHQPGPETLPPANHANSMKPSPAVQVPNTTLNSSKPVGGTAPTMNQQQPMGGPAHPYSNAYRWPGTALDHQWAVASRYGATGPQQTSTIRATVSSYPSQSQQQPPAQ